ncbi:hypothetical protein B0H14DRAFT_3904594 [Mycena olivaceomarginata]|nr:hypothetical protein B0H14DRAFT_3904594 [Mycena olivaceomarginata]
MFPSPLMTPHHLLQVPSPALVIPLALHLAPVHCRLRRTCTVYVHHQCSQGCVHGAWGSALPPAVDLSVKQLLDAIPAHCFKCSALKSSVYTLWHLSIGGISKTAAYADTFINRRLSRHQVAPDVSSSLTLPSFSFTSSAAPNASSSSRTPTREPDDAAQRHPVVCVAPLPLPHPSSRGSSRAGAAGRDRHGAVVESSAPPSPTLALGSPLSSPLPSLARERGEVVGAVRAGQEVEDGGSGGDGGGEEEQQHRGDAASPSAMQLSTLTVQFANTDARSPTANPNLAHTAPASFSSSPAPPPLAHITTTSTGHAVPDVHCPLRTSPPSLFAPPALPLPFTRS